MKEKISYDEDEDILYYNSGKQVQDSIQVGDMFIEFSADNEIVGVEILNASETISNLTGKEFTSVELGSIRDAELKMFTKEDFVFVNLFFNTVAEGETVQERIGVNIPTQAVTA